MRSFREDSLSAAQAFDGRAGEVCLEARFYRARRSAVGAADLMAGGLLVVLAGLVLSTFRQYGVTFDEGVQDEYGRMILSWYATLGHERGAVEFMDLYFYGGLFDTVAALANLVSPFGHWESRHLLNAAVGVGGIAGAWALARRLGGPVAGLVALLTLALWPSWYGMMFANPKDIPFGTATVWALYFMTRVAEALPRPPLQVTLALGISLGAALATRVGGLLPVAYFLVLLGSFALTDPRGWAARLTRGVHVAFRIGLPVLLLAWAVMLVFWPFAQLAPIANPLQAAHHFATLNPEIDTLYFGREVSADYNPLGYLPTYLVLKAPELALATLAAALPMLAWRAPGMLRSALVLRYLPLALSLLVPAAYVVLGRPQLYDAERHFLFLLPSLAVLVGLAFRLLLTRVRGGTRLALLGALLLGAGAQAHEMAKLHPYEYVYFNVLVGGLRGAQGRFETEYWGASLTEAAERVGRENLLGLQGRRLTVTVCGNPAGVRDRLPAWVDITNERSEADLFIASTRHRCHEELTGRTILTVEREGVPFAVVKELRTSP